MIVSFFIQSQVFFILEVHNEDSGMIVNGQTMRLFIKWLM